MRSRQRRRSATDAAHPLRVLSARPRRRRGMFFRIHQRAVMIARPQLSLRGHSSSQASYPSPCRKRQGSSISLLVLSKQQTLRWFAVWSQFCLARKKYAKKRRWTRNSADARKNESLHSTYYRYIGGQGTPFGRRAQFCIRECRTAVNI